MIPSFKPGILSSNSIRAAGGGDVTPSNSFDFGYNFSQTGYVTSNTVTVAGINTPITLRITQVSNDGYNYLSVYLNSTEISINSIPYDFNVSNGDTIFFEIQLTNPGYIFLYNVYNQSDGGVLLSENNGFEFFSDPG